MTKLFLDLVQVYCNVLEEYPGILEKTEGFRLLLVEKELEGNMLVAKISDLKQALEA